MGWDYYQYVNQPTWFIEQIKKYFVEEYKALKKR